ncbi:MAG: substrate-binding periplasmic protein [Anaerolineae bacterium]
MEDDGALERIHIRGVLRVGVDASFPPFAWLDVNGMPTGYEVELAEYIAAYMGVRAQMVNLSFDSLYDTLQAGRVDMIISELTYDERRTREVIYSRPYFDGGQLLVVSLQTKDNVLETDDINQLLNGRRVAVEWGSMGDMKVRQLQGDIVRYSTLTYPSAQEALVALASGKVDAAIVDAVSAYQFIAAHPNKMRIVCYLTHEPYVIATSARSRRFATAINTALTTLKDTGILDYLHKRWLTTPIQ